MGPGPVYPPCCPWTGFGHWGRADLASAQCPVGRAGKLHGDGWRKTFMERAVRSWGSSPCSGHCLSAPTIVPRLALGPTEPGTTLTPTHPIPGAAFPAGPQDLWWHLGMAGLWLTPVATGLVLLTLGCGMGLVREGGHCTTLWLSRPHQATLRQAASWKMSLEESSGVRSQALLTWVQT